MPDEYSVTVKIFGARSWGERILQSVWLALAIL